MITSASVTGDAFLIKRHFPKKSVYLKLGTIFQGSGEPRFSRCHPQLNYILPSPLRLEQFGWGLFGCSFWFSWCCALKESFLRFFYLTLRPAAGNVLEWSMQGNCVPNMGDRVNGIFHHPHPAFVQRSDECLRPLFQASNVLVLHNIFCTGPCDWWSQTKTFVQNLWSLFHF